MYYAFCEGHAKKDHMMVNFSLSADFVYILREYAPNGMH